METKPFSLQSPEQIAKDYGGNKQKIAEAMQMGLLDPTAGTLAGMFIDRIRAAAQQEGAPQQTVAQQVFASPTPPPMGAPPMGMPQGLGQPSVPQTPMVGGGLAGIPVPDDMFDEPQGGYAGGGLVAFAGGGITEQKAEEEEPEEMYGFYRDPRKQMEMLQQLYQPKTEMRERAKGMFGGMLDPEQQKKRLSEDKWMALGQIGAKMAQTPGSLFQALGAGIESALPGIREASKERRAEVRDAVLQMAQLEGLDNKDAMELAKEALSGTKTFAELRMTADRMRQEKELAIMEDKTRRYGFDTSAAAQLGAARIQADSYAAHRKSQEDALDKQARNDAMKAALADVTAASRNIAPKTAEEQAKLDNLFRERFNFYYQSYTGAPSTGAPTSVSNYGSPPPGAVKRVG